MKRFHSSTSLCIIKSVVFVMISSLTLNVIEIIPSSLQLFDVECDLWEVYEVFHLMLLFGTFSFAITRIEIPELGESCLDKPFRKPNEPNERNISVEETRCFQRHVFRTRVNPNFS
jgi:hypothetical protein